MPDYDLGTAHGRVVIDYDDKGAKAAAAGMEDLESQAEELEGAFDKLIRKAKELHAEHGSLIKRFGLAASAAAAVGVAYVVAARNALFLRSSLTALRTTLMGLGASFGGVARNLVTFRRSLLGLGAGVSIIGNLLVAMGRLPRRASFLPRFAQQIIRVGAAFLIWRRAMPIIANLAGRLAALGGVAPLLRRLGTDSNGVRNAINALGAAGNTLGRPIVGLGRLALAAGGLIAGSLAALKMAKGMLALGAAAGAVWAAVTAVWALADAAVELSKNLLLVPAGLFALVTVGATLALGLKGIGTAMKALGKDTAEFEKAIKGLAPSAQETMRALRGFKDQAKDLQQTIQQKLFANWGKELKIIGDTYLPILKVGLGGVAEALNRSGQELFKFLKNGQTIQDFGDGFLRVRHIVDNLNGTIQPLLEAFRDIGMVGLEALDDLTAGAGNAAASFRDFIAEARKTGELRAWMEEGIQAARDLWNILVNIKNIFSTIFEAFGFEGGTALSTLRDLTAQLDAFLKSAEGQAALELFVTAMKNMAMFTGEFAKVFIQELGPALVELQPLIESMADAMGTTLVTALQILGPLLTEVARALSFMAPVLGPVLGVLLGLGLLAGGLGAAFAALMVVVGTMQTGWTVLKTALKIVTALFKGLWRVLGGAKALTRVGEAFAKLSPRLGILLRMLPRLAGLVGLGVTLWDAMGWAMEKLGFKMMRLGDLIEFFKDLFTGNWGDVADFFKRIVTEWLHNVQLVWDKLSAFGKWIGGVFKGPFQAIADWFSGPFADVFRGLWEIISGPVKMAITIVTGIIRAGLAVMSAVWTAGWTVIKAVAMTIWSAISAWFSAWWGLLYSIFQLWLSLVMLAVRIAWFSIKTFTLLIWDTISAYFKLWWALITAVFQVALAVIQAVVTAVWNFIKAITETIWNAIKAFMEVIWQLITAVIQAALNVIVPIVQTGFNLIKSIIETVMNAVRSAVEIAWSLIQAAFSVAIGVCKGLVDGLKAALEVFMDVVDKLMIVVGPALNALQGAFGTAFGAMKSVVDGVLASINAIASAAKKAKSAIDSITPGGGGGLLSPLGIDGPGPLKKGGWAGQNASGGGWIRGTGTKDKYLHILAADEFVTNAKAAMKNAHLLSHLNQGMDLGEYLRRYAGIPAMASSAEANGRMIAAAAGAATSAPAVVVNGGGESRTVNVYGASDHNEYKLAKEFGYEMRYMEMQGRYGRAFAQR